MLVPASPDDTVELRPLWPALLSTLRFARSSHWRFGHAAADLRCDEGAPRRWLTAREPWERLQLGFDLTRWNRASVRAAGDVREFHIQADDATLVAVIHVDAAQPAIDELIWRLVADEPAIAPIPVAANDAIGEERLHDELAVCASRADFDAVIRRERVARQRALTIAGPQVARRLRPGAVVHAIRAARAAGLALRFRLENTGGAVTWAPRHLDLDARSASLELRAGRITVDLSTAAASWMVELDTPDVCCPAIESSMPGDRGWVRIDVADTGEATCETWRRICADGLEES